jgi:hypothetical protein
MIHIARGKKTVLVNGGFIKVIILIVILLIALGFYGFDLKHYIDSMGVKKHLARPLLWLQDKIQGILPDSN